LSRMHTRVSEGHPPRILKRWKWVREISFMSLLTSIGWMCTFDIYLKQLTWPFLPQIRQLGAHRFKREELISPWDALCRRKKPSLVWVRHVAEKHFGIPVWVLKIVLPWIR
jgi:hypothetical protein